MSNIYGEYRSVDLENVQQAAHDANAMAAFVTQCSAFISGLRKLQADVQSLEAKNMIGDTLLGVGDALDENLYAAQAMAEEYLAECEAEVGEARMLHEMAPPMLSLATGRYERVNLVAAE